MKRTHKEQVLYMITKEIFKPTAYDIRGVYPDQLNEETAYAVAQAYAKLFAPKTVVLGRDVRLSGPSLWKAAAQGFTDHGVNVIDIGVITSDMLAFATAHYDVDGGMIISASHNPVEYNGIKIMKRGAVSVSGETGIMEIRDVALSGYRYRAEAAGSISALDIQADYLNQCRQGIETAAIKPLTVVVNGMFGPVVKNIEALKLPIQLIKLNAEPDGSFPKGPPDPLLPENRTETIELIKKTGADCGAAWDGDADRFFLFDEKGRFIYGYFLTAFFGAYFCKQTPGARVVHDPRLVWAIQESVKAAGGVPVANKVGHAFIKDRMRKEDAVFGGESSGHFYFKNFFYADNGLIPFLLMLEIISKSGKKVSELFDPYFEQYFFPDEVNLPLATIAAAAPILSKLEKQYADAVITRIDGLSLEYPDWYANIRASNTQPLLRINLEARSAAVKEQKLNELLSFVKSNS